jgi:hypothetical protein
MSPVAPAPPPPVRPDPLRVLGAWCLHYHRPVVGLVLFVLWAVLAASLPREPILDYGLAFALGAMFGAGELVSRYRDNPWRAVACAPGWGYLTLNGFAAFFALVVIHAFDFKFGFPAAAADTAKADPTKAAPPAPPSEPKAKPADPAPADPKAQPTAAKPAAPPSTPDPAADTTVWTTANRLRLWRILAAGLAAMALFRSSLFTLRIGTQDVQIGPNELLKRLLFAVDRGVDRVQADRRDAFVTAATTGLPTWFDPDYVATTFVPYCFGLMQNVTKDEQQQIAQEVARITQQPVNPRDQVQLIMLQLLPLLDEVTLAGVIRRHVAAGQPPAALLPPAPPLPPLPPPNPPPPIGPPPASPPPATP